MGSGVFGVAKIYALATDRALQRWLAFGGSSDATEHRVLIMPILIEAQESLSDALLKKLKREIELVSKTPNNIEILHGTQSGIWGLFSDMLVVNWMYTDDEKDYDEKDYDETVKQDVHAISAQLPTLIAKIGLPNNTVARYALHEGKLAAHSNASSQPSLASQWRSLFALAVIKLEHPKLEDPDISKIETP